ncbi:hypothetical protein GCM10009642_35690 [Nocardiopsis metallicus]
MGAQFVGAYACCVVTGHGGHRDPAGARAAPGPRRILPDPRHSDEFGGFGEVKVAIRDESALIRPVVRGCR